jgi:prevent-host-death family protein
MSTIPRIIPISDLRQDAAGVIKRATENDEPVFITQRGRASAVLMSTRAYERDQRKLEILLMLVQGEREIAAGDVRDFDDVMAEAWALLNKKTE